MSRLTKLITLSMILTLLLTTVSVSAKENIENTKEDDVLVSISLDNQREEASKELEKNGTVKNIEKRIKKYYKDNEKYLLKEKDYKGLSDSEFEELVKTLENENSELDGTVEIKSGSNDMSWVLFTDGDVVLVHDGFCAYGYYRHAGTYDSVIDACRSAQKVDSGNGTGVMIESESWYNDNYDEAVGVSPYVSVSSSKRDDVIDFIEDQMGEPYSATASYYTWTAWSCIKLPWVAWWEEGDINIAVDVLTGDPLSKYGTVCFPDSVYQSDNTYCFASGD